MEYIVSGDEEDGEIREDAEGAQDTTTAARDAGENARSEDAEEDVTWDDLVKSVQAEMGVKVEEPSATRDPEVPAEVLPSSEKKAKKRKQDKELVETVSDEEKPKVEKSPKADKKYWSFW